MKKNSFVADVTFNVTVYHNRFLLENSDLRLSYLLAPSDKVG